MRRIQHEQSLDSVVHLFDLRLIISGPGLQRLGDEEALEEGHDGSRIVQFSEVIERRLQRVLRDSHGRTTSTRREVTAT